MRLDAFKAAAGGFEDFSRCTIIGFADEKKIADALLAQFVHAESHGAMAEAAAAKGRKNFITDMVGGHRRMHIDLWTQRDAADDSVACDHPEALIAPRIGRCFDDLHDCLCQPVGERLR